MSFIKKTYFKSKTYKILRCIKPILSTIIVEDIKYLYTRYKKGDNTHINKKREDIIFTLAHMNPRNNLFLQDKTYGKKWRKYQKKLIHMLSNFVHMKNGTKFDIIQTGGRKCKYDFNISIYGQNADGTNHCNIMKLEYKHQPNFKSLPQIYQISNITHPLFDYPYWEYYFINTIPKIRKLFLQDLPEITKEQYIKIAKKSLTAKKITKILSKEPTNVKLFFDMLWKLSISSPQQQYLFYEQVALSIDEYLISQQITPEIVRKIQDELQQKQSDKYFMFWKDNDWYIRYIPENFILTGEIELKKGKKYGPLLHTIIFKTEKGNKIEYLLRWKNHIGVSLPAWQIKFRHIMK